MRTMCSAGAFNPHTFLDSNHCLLYVFQYTILRPKKKNSCVQVSLPTLSLGPTLKMLIFC